MKVAMSSQNYFSQKLWLWKKRLYSCKYLNYKPKQSSYSRYVKCTNKVYYCNYK